MDIFLLIIFWIITPFIIVRLILYLSEKRYLNQNKRCSKGLHLWENYSESNMGIIIITEKLVCNNCGALAEEWQFPSADSCPHIRIIKKGKFSK